jgi:acetyl esterase/lipase
MPNRRSTTFPPTLLTRARKQVLAISLCASAALVSAQSYAPGPQEVTYRSDADDTNQPYGLYVPKNLNPAKKYPLVIMLHGSGINHRLALRRVFGWGNVPGENDPRTTRVFREIRDVDYIVAAPLARGSIGYQGMAEKDVYDVIADVKHRFPIDEDRVYLTGFESGGGGALWLGLTRPDVWAAIAPVCPAPPEATVALIGNALNIPVRMFQGEIDPLVKAEQTRSWNREMLDAGIKAEYIEYPGVRHNAWDYAYKNADIFSWFDQYRRNAFPERVRFAARDYGHAKAYWITLDELTPGALATIDAVFQAKNKLKIETANLDAFTLKLKGHPMLAMTQLLSISVDGTTLKVKPQNSVSLTKQPTGWIIKRSVPLSSQKHQGQEGPMREAIASRQIYVYGTGNAASPDELIRRRNQAAFAAEWSTERSPIAVTNRVLPDAEIKEADIHSSNLILFGNKETNSVIAKLHPHLPMHLNAGAADYGLVFITPTRGTQYAVINSGLPWWSHADQAKRPGLPLIPSPHTTLESFGDFILFKGGLENVIIEGNFDRDWKLPPEAVAKIKETGAVTLP